MKALKNGILWICNECEDYSKLDINSKINFKSEVAYYWNSKYCKSFQKHIKPVIQEFKDKSVEDFIFQEYLFAVGL